MVRVEGDDEERHAGCAERIELGDVATYTIDESESADDGMIVLDFELAKTPCDGWRDAFAYVKTLQLNYGCATVELHERMLRVVTRPEEREGALVALHVHIALTNLRVEQNPRRGVEVDP